LQAKDESLKRQGNRFKGLSYSSRIKNPTYYVGFLIFYRKPFDGGVSILLAAGVGYGIKKYREGKKVLQRMSYK